MPVGLRRVAMPVLMPTRGDRAVGVFVIVVAIVVAMPVGVFDRLVMVLVLVGFTLEEPEREGHQADRYGVNGAE